MDFYKIKERSIKKGVVEIYPDFAVDRTKDLMVRGNAFYAIWDEKAGMWSKDEYDVARLADEELFEYYQKCKQRNSDIEYHLKTFGNYSSGCWNQFKKYLKQLADNYSTLDTKVTFMNTEVSKKDHVSKRVPYSIQEGNYDSYDELISTLYSDEEKQKIEWAIGAILTGDAKHIQKFIVFYGEGGTGKSTMLNIIQKLFQGYYITFDAKELTVANNAYTSGALFVNDPLVAIQHDGDLSGIKDNSKLNSIVAHEEILVNEKFKAQYTARSNCFLFMGTNKPVKITDGKSGIIRRLIDVHPTGNKIPAGRYNDLMVKIDFELGAIAYHCKEVYLNLGKGYYNSYKPMDMMYKTDPFFNFVQEQYYIFKENDGTTLKAAYALYKQYIEDSDSESGIMAKYKFREELKNYFKTFTEETRTADGKHIYSYYNGFLHKKFEKEQAKVEDPEQAPISLSLIEQESLLDKVLAECPAQYANEYETPSRPWSEVRTKLKDLDTSKLHYVLPDNPNHIFIDFDLKDDDGNKSYEKNLEAASKFPATYAETSKSGAGIHLHYIYDSDVSLLSRLYDEGIEIKVLTGNSALRRKVIKCNNLPIAHIGDGLPLKGDKKMISFENVKNEKAIRTLIIKNLKKEYHANTKPSINFIYDILEKAYDSGLHYDVSDLQGAVYKFALNSSNQSDYCAKLVDKMHFKSEEPSEPAETVERDKDIIIFFDVEVFPNLFIICWKMQGDHQVVQMINPKPVEVERLIGFKLIGFNNRKYDNHIIYAAMMGYTNEQLYRLSRKIIEEKTGFFSEAYNLSYTDIYDYSSAANKKSLKKWEIELGITHIENSYPWNEPVAKEHWLEIADYCKNDVLATEAVHNRLNGDWTARQILAEWAGMTCNDTTNNLSAKIIFGNNKNPQIEFNYRDLSKPVRPENLDFTRYRKDKIWRIFDENGEPTFTIWKPGTELPLGYSIMPFFPGYEFDAYKRHSSYEDVETIGEGGYVYSEPDMYGSAETDDVASEHPSSIDEEDLFGPVYTENFRTIKNGRLAIKHDELEYAKSILPEVVHKYINNIESASDLANAMKTVINAVYGQTCATYNCVFKDPRNKDNIVAKRGALFMIKLRLRVQNMGYQVMHCKTDSIKIVNPTKEIRDFINAYGKEFGYNFEIEHEFEKICLVDKANYIAKLTEKDEEWIKACKKATKKSEEKGTPYIEPTRWTATGDKFSQPYVFKTLFSHEDTDINDLSEVKSVKSALYLDMNEGLPEGEHNYIFVGRVGQFVPVKDGYGGGELMRLSGYDENGNPKYAAAEGTKGWRWKETEVVKSLNQKEQINIEYWRQKIDDVIATLSEYGDVDRFLSDAPYEEFVAMNKLD